MSKSNRSWDFKWFDYNKREGQKWFSSSIHIWQGSLCYKTTLVYKKAVYQQTNNIDR